MAAILAFLNTLSHAFVYDDALLISEPLLQSLAGWREILTSPFFHSAANDIDVWRPVASLSFALDFAISRARIGAPDPLVFHAGNVFWHALSSGLVGVLALRLGLGRAAALASGLLFALHPIHVEAVANVYQRQELLAASFGVAFLLAHVAARPLAAGVLLLLALGSKESALGFVPIPFLLDALVLRRRWRRASAWIPIVVAVGAYLFLRSHALEGVQARPMMLENPAATAPFLERIATAARVQLLYLRLLLWPVGLSSDYSFDEIALVSSLLSPFVIGFVGLVAAAACVSWRCRSKRPRVALDVLAYASLFAVTSNFLLPIGTIAGERLVYAPSIAVCLLFAEGVNFAVERGRARIALLCVAAVIAACAALTVRRNAVWKDDLTLFRDQVATAPRSAKAHLNLGIVLQRAGEDAEAARELQASVAIFPEHSHTWYALGNALYNLRAEPKLVVQAFENALRYGPMHHDARVKFAIVLIQLHAPDLAGPQIEMLARLAPGHPKLPELRALLAAEEQRAR
jgi:hypothetical protein